MCVCKKERGGRKKEFESEKAIALQILLTWLKETSLVDITFPFVILVLTIQRLQNLLSHTLSFRINTTSVILSELMKLQRELEFET